MRKIYAIGETVLDIIFKDGKPVSATPGGSALNTAISLGRLGMNVHFISEYGTDRAGSMIDGFLNRNGVKTDCICRYKGNSSLALAFLDENNNAAYDFYKNYPPKRLDIRFPEPTANDILLFGSFYGIDPLIHERLKPFLEHARNCGALILYDPNFRASHLPELADRLPVITANFRFADIVKGSVEDFRYIFGAKNSRETWQKLDKLCDMLVYTADKHNVELYLANVREEYPVPPLQPVSTIGAGDTFNAGLVYGMVQHEINKKNLKSMNAEQRVSVIETAIRFAREVCLIYDNYISCEFAAKYRNNTKHNLPDQNQI
ncbi:MAG: PfkB family carbohydrate kinase [Bacteroidales bacterium]|jgi:fructokinase|nr:PfkB family carbohydrate kinase [Bacteroidales bacterium]